VVAAEISGDLGEEKKDEDHQITVVALEVATDIVVVAAIDRVVVVAAVVIDMVVIAMEAVREVVIDTVVVVAMVIALVHLSSETHKEEEDATTVENLRGCRQEERAVDLTVLANSQLMGNEKGVAPLTDIATMLRLRVM